MKQQVRHSLSKFPIRDGLAAADAFKEKDTVRILTILLTGTTLLTATGCADIAARQRDTTIDAGVDRLAGAVLIGGPSTTLGGATPGDLVGNVSTR